MYVSFTNDVVANRIIKEVKEQTIFYERIKKLRM